MLLLSIFRPASSSVMPSSTAAVLSFILLLVMNVLVGMSDSASVPISAASDDYVMESLASSRILSDDTSSTPTATTLFNNKITVPTAPLISQQQANGNENSIEVDEDGLPKEVKSGSPSQSPASGNSYEMSSSSPLHVARCRATCLEKVSEFTNSTPCSKLCSELAHKLSHFSQTSKTNQNSKYLARNSYLTKSIVVAFFL